MRKVILALVLMLPFVFQSCSDDDDISLVGTVWIYSQTYYGSTSETHLKFIDKTKAQMRLFEDGVEVEALEVTYVVSGSNITLTLGDEILSGTISGNEMTFVIEDEEGRFELLFVKQ